MKKLLSIALLVASFFATAQNGKNPWKVNVGMEKNRKSNKATLPEKKLYDLDLMTLKSVLTTSPKRNANVKTSNAIITLPTADGGIESFRVYENPVMEEALAEKYPEIKSYVAMGVENVNARAYFSISPLGFKSMTIYPDKSAVFIEPLSSDLVTYTVYKKSDSRSSMDRMDCTVIDQASRDLNTSVAARPNADDAKLRTFRLALSCTAEYTSYFGGTKALALAGMNNTMTRCNAIFESDFGLRLVMIANTDTVIYTNAITDPYADATSMSSWNAQLQANLTAAIGDSNYDIGHLLGGTGGGGNAGCIGCVCVSGSKGKGYTSPSSGIPEGDNFDIDYVAHEMGHQLGANHTFTHVTESGSVAQMEPGSGSTIMSYAGITSKDIQRHSDPYFHAISIQQVTNNIKTKTCPTIIATGNTAPIVNAGLDYTIPKGTPFVLTGSATDVNGDNLNYIWEEMDLGNSTTATPLATATTGPLFRSFGLSTTPTRYFPKMTSILTGSNITSGTEIPVEVLPAVARTLNFRLTARDNRIGGPSNNSDDTLITVNGTAGPFNVTSPNTAVNYTGGSSQVISWNVAGTTANGVNCAAVDILLSTDGGLTFPTTLLTGTPNDGSQNVVIPNTAGNTNRIMIKGNAHIFFDVSDANFTITIGTVIADSIAPIVGVLSASGTTVSSTNLSWTAAIDNVGVTSYSIYQNGVLKATTTATTFAVTGLTASTSYAFYIIAKDAAGNSSSNSNTATVVTSSLADTLAPTSSTLTASGTTTSSTNLSWTTASDNVGVTGYNIYQNGVFKASTTATTYAVTGLSAATSYGFYIVVKDAAGNSSSNSNTATVVTASLADTLAPTSSTLTASGTTVSTTNLSWSAASDNVGVTGYNIYQNGVFKASTTATTYAVTGLSAATSYGFYIVVKDAAGNSSSNSNTATVVTASLADTLAPTSSTLTASGTTVSTTNLSWNTATDNVGVTSYNIYQNGVFKASTTATTYAVTGLSAATSYGFYIVVKDAAGNSSSNSNTATVVTASLADTLAPTSSTLTASGTTTSSTNLSWNTATDNVGVTSYNIYQNGVFKASTTATTYAVTGLSAATSYGFYIVVKDAAGNSSSNSNTATVVTSSLADTLAPTSSTLTASGTTVSTTNLSWSAASDNVGVTGYNIYQNGVFKASTTATTYAVTGLSAATSYGFYIVAKDAAGNSSPTSNTATIITLTLADSSAPTSSTLTASGTTTSSTNLSWTTASDNVGVMGYNIYQNGVFKATTTATTYAVTGLSAATSYGFYIVVKDAAGNSSSASNSVTITTPGIVSTYCISVGSSTDREYINKVQIGTIDNLSGNNGGYANYTSLSTNLTMGSSTSITIIPTWTTRSTYAEAYCVWIDFNQDGDFNDFGEQVINQSKCKVATFTGKVFVPTSALVGTTRMRVSMKYNASPTSCETFTYGEVEDYTVNITALGRLDDETVITEPLILIYPNPVKGDQLNISNLENKASFTIYTMTGQVVAKDSIENESVYVGSLPTGYYLIEIIDGNKKVTKHFIKE